MADRALIYTRVSQDRAGGRSPAEQEAEARDVCQREGWHVAEVVTDSAGASRHSKGTRSGWARARRMVEAGDVDVLVTWEASRAQRDLAAYAELRDLCVASGVRWCYSGRTYDLAESEDRFRTGLDALLAEREADEIAGRVRRAMRSNAAAGRPHGRRLFGYRRVYDDATGALAGQEPHPVEAAVVRRIFDDYLAGAGIRTVARRLNADGATTGTGAAWTDAQVRRVLVNPAYAARRVHRGERVGDAAWPALVDPDRFDLAAARLAAHRSSGARQRHDPHLLTGVGRCGLCAGKVRVLADRRGRRFYECRDRHCVARDRAKLDAHVADVVLARIARPDMAAALDGAEPPEVTSARAEATDLRARLDDAVAEFTAGRLTAATLARIEADLLPRVDAAEGAVRRAVVPIEVDVPDDAGLAWWEDVLTGEQRRAIVAALVAAVVILPAVRGTRRFDQATVRLEWRS